MSSSILPRAALPSQFADASAPVAARPSHKAPNTQPFSIRFTHDESAYSGLIWPPILELSGHAFCFIWPVILELNGHFWRLRQNRRPLSRITDHLIPESLSTHCFLTLICTLLGVY